MGLGSVDQLGANFSGLTVARELAQNARRVMCPLRAKNYLQTDPKSSHGACGKALSGIFK